MVGSDGWCKCWCTGYVLHEECSWRRKHLISPKSNQTGDDTRLVLSGSTFIGTRLVASYINIGGHARLDMRFIEIKVINCIDTQNCLINYLDPVLLEQTRPGDAKHKINLIWPKMLYLFPKSLNVWFRLIFYLFRVPFHNIFYYYFLLLRCAYTTRRTTWTSPLRCVWRFLRPFFSSTCTMTLYLCTVPIVVSLSTSWTPPTLPHTVSKPFFSRLLEY